MSETQATQTPRHLWIVGIVALLWNLIGAMDYIMTQTRNEAYMDQFTPEQLEFFYGFPVWLIAFWALAVWAVSSVPSSCSCARSLRCPSCWFLYFAWW